MRNYNIFVLSLLFTCFVAVISASASSQDSLCSIEFGTRTPPLKQDVKGIISALVTLELKDYDEVERKSLDELADIIVSIGLKRIRANRDRLGGLLCCNQQEGLQRDASLNYSANYLLLALYKIRFGVPLGRTLLRHCALKKISKLAAAGLNDDEDLVEMLCEINDIFKLQKKLFARRSQERYERRKKKERRARRIKKNAEEYEKEKMDIDAEYRLKLAEMAKRYGRN